MPDERRQVKNHLAAAKRWLGDAENSLEKEEDIKSELDMMLAAAEIRRAQEKKELRRTKWQKRLRDAAPLAVALVIAAVWFFLRPSPNAPLAAVKPPAPPAAPVVPKPVSPEAKESAPPAAEKTADSPAPPANQPQTDENKSSSAPIAVLPPGDLQRLIGEAGRQLRRT